MKKQWYYLKYIGKEITAHKAVLWFWLLVRVVVQTALPFLQLLLSANVIQWLLEGVEIEYYLLNDYNATIIGLLRYFKDNNASQIIQQIKDTIVRHNILKGFNKRDPNETEEYKELAKTNYNKFRDYYNNVDKSMLNLYVLSYY